jgi:hypothetical protein
VTSAEIKQARCAYRDWGADRSYAKVGRWLGKSTTLINRWSSRWDRFVAQLWGFKTLTVRLFSGSCTSVRGTAMGLQNSSRERWTRSSTPPPRWSSTRRCPRAWTLPDEPLGLGMYIEAPQLP